MYDYFLGGSHNFAVDRQAARQALAHMPGLPAVLHANRAFLRRAVRQMVEAGVRQFLDLGSGIPAVGNVHEIAQQVDPTISVVYVDVDPVAFAVAETILAGNPYATMIQADLRDTDRVLADPAVHRLLDLDRPLGVLMVAVLHLVPDCDDPAGILDRLHDAVAPGSYLAVSHMCPEERQTPAGMREARDAYARSGNPLHPRTYEQVEALLSGWRMQPPGLVACPQWRPDPDTEPLDPTVTYPGLAALVRKHSPARPEATRRTGTTAGQQGVVPRSRQRS